MSEENLRFCRDYIDSVNWKFAKTYAEKAPHEYTVKQWVSSKYDDFEHFIELIREYGFQRKYYRQTWTYLLIDGLEYFTHPGPVKETPVINRAKPPEPGAYSE
jgi:hypothetical protein